MPKIIKNVLIFSKLSYNIRPQFSKLYVFSPKYLYIIVTKKLDVNLKITIKIHWLKI